jgi:hypothetical protein
MSSSAAPQPRRFVRVHPLAVRITHWVNVYAMVCMIMSGCAIYNASPLFAFRFPAWATLGGWLGGAIAWHLACMWLLAGNGIVYVGYGLISGHFRRNLLPLWPDEILRDARDAVRMRLHHRRAAPGLCRSVDARSVGDSFRPRSMEASATIRPSNSARWLRSRSPCPFRRYGGHRRIHRASSDFGAFGSTHIAEHGDWTRTADCPSRENIPMKRKALIQPESHRWRQPTRQAPSPSRSLSMPSIQWMMHRRLMATITGWRSPAL